MSRTIAKASPTQQLQMLAQLTKMSGGLHEAQVIHLKIWPLLVFDASASEFTWDPDTKKVTFKLKPATSLKKTPSMRQRAETLGQWVQTLLGKEWSIDVVTPKKTYTVIQAIYGEPLKTK